MTDAFGRRSSHQRQSTGKRLRLSDRDLFWLEKLQEHGPLPTSYLLVFTEALRASDKRQQERLSDLFHEENTNHGGAYLDRPPQQFATLKAGYNQLVHQVASAGQKALKDAKRFTDRGGHHGPWLHRHMVACVTASVEIACLKRGGISFIPQQQILDRAKTTLSYPVRVQDRKTGSFHRKDLKPDALFGLKYHTQKGDRFRFFAVEADRGTEPVTSRNWNRKSFQRHLVQYDAYIGGEAYREHLQLTAPLLVLNVVPDVTRLDAMVRHTERQLGSCSYQLFQTFPEFAAPWRPPEPNHALLESAWLRTCQAPFNIDQA